MLIGFRIKGTHPELMDITQEVSEKTRIPLSVCSLGLGLDVLSCYQEFSSLEEGLPDLLRVQDELIKIGKGDEAEIYIDEGLGKGFIPHVRYTINLEQRLKQAGHVAVHITTVTEAFHRDNYDEGKW